MRVGRSRVRHISTNDDSGLVSDVGHHVRAEVVVGATELDVDLESDVGAVLLLGRADVLDLHALGRDTNDRVGHALDLGVQGDTGVGEDTDQDLGLRLDLIAGVEVELLESALDVAVRVRIGHVRSLVDNVQANFLASHDQVADETLEADLGTVALGTKEDNAPGAKGRRLCQLLVAEVPLAVSGSKVRFA